MTAPLYAFLTLYWPHILIGSTVAVCALSVRSAWVLANATKRVSPVTNKQNRSTKLY